MDGIRGRILQFCDQLMTLAYLNILWIGFSLLGFIICGFFPATVAMYTLIRRDLTDSKLDSSLASEFWKEYKLCFRSANLFGYTFICFGTVLILDLIIFLNLNTVVGYVMASILTTLLIVYLLMTIFSLPVFVHFVGGTWKLVKKTSTLAIPLLPHALLFILASTLLLALFIIIPAAVVFFSGSILAWLNVKLFLSGIKRIEQKQLATEPQT